jgi:hypothetical protein
LTNPRSELHWQRTLHCADLREMMEEARPAILEEAR